MSSNGSPTDLCLRAPARAASLVLLRQMLHGLRGLFALRPGLSDAVETAVSEAANNVVQHAYPDGGPGALEVDVWLGGPLEIRVRDHGVGFDTQGFGEVHSSGAVGDAGLGSAVIAAMSDGFELDVPPGGGTELRLGWEMPCMLDGGLGVELPVLGETIVALVPRIALAASLSGALVAVGAAAYLNTDSLSLLRRLGGVLLSDAAPGLNDGMVLDLSTTGAAVEISVGPFWPGAATAVLSGPHAGSSPRIDRLSEHSRVSVDPASGLESLLLVVS